MSWEGRQCQIQNPAEPCCRRIFGRSAQRNAQIGLNGYFLSGLLFLQRQSRIFGCGRQRFLCSLNLPGTVVLQSVSAPHPQSPPEISARTGEQRHVIPVFPPLPDKIGFISVKDILCNQLLKALNPYSYSSRHAPCPHIPYTFNNRLSLLYQHNPTFIIISFLIPLYIFLFRHTRKSSKS